MEHNRACDPCKKHKVRCFPDTSLTNARICQRCARTDRDCIYTAPPRRKQRKRTDTRVAELEREVQAMRSLLEGKEDKLQATQTNQSPISSNTSTQQETPDYASKSTPLLRTSPSREQLPGPQIALQEDAQPSASNPEDLDVIDRGIISLELATELFQVYLRDLVPHFPAVVFASGVSAAEIRQSKPILFLSIVAVASGMSDPHLYSILNAEVISAYAQKIVIGCQKSMELVQAMIVTSVWYSPVGKFAQLKFFEYIHMAATMGIDIGLGKNPNTLRRRRETANEALPASDEGNVEKYEDIERRRTFLVCYLITTGVALSMRRPGMLHYNNWINECADLLAKSPYAAPSDKILVGWVRLMYIAENFSISLAFDDPANMPSLSEQRVQLMLKSFEKRLDTWRDALEPDTRSNDALMLVYHHNKMFLHEIALHEDHPPEDFLPPFRIDQVLLPDPERNVTASYIEAISVCIDSAHSLIERMLGLGIVSFRALPVFNFVRGVYALIILIKLYLSVRSESSQIGKFIDRETLRIPIYLPAMINRLSDAVGPRQCRSPSRFLGLLVRLQAWYDKQESHAEFTGLVQLFDPEQVPTDSNPGGKMKDTEFSISELIKTDVANEPIGPMQANFDNLRVNPLGNFLGPEHSDIMAMQSVSNTPLAQLRQSFIENDLFFDPSQPDFELDPYWFPEDMDFMEMEDTEWLTTVDVP